MISSAYRVAALALIAFVLAGCSTPPAPTLTLDDVSNERVAALEATARERLDLFVHDSADRLRELGLPIPEFAGLVDLDELDAVVSQCISSLNPRLQVARPEGGFTVTYFGTVGDTYDRISWAVDSCNAQYAVADLHVATEPGPVEQAWSYVDLTQRVLPCLRIIGVPVPSPPSEADFARGLGTASVFDPLSLIADDLAALERAEALCPPTATVMQAHLDGIEISDLASEPGS